MVISRVYILKYILFFTFITNAFLGHPYSNLTVLMLPLNEWMLVVSLILISPSIPDIIKTYPILIPILLWSVGYLLLSVPFGLAKYGIWAGRDALHLVEVWWLVVTLFVLSKIDIQSEFKKALLVVYYAFFLKLIVTLAGESLQGVFVIQGVQGELDLFSSKAGFSLIVFLMLWVRVVKLKIGVIIPILVLIFIAILQARAIYVGLISSLFLYFYVRKFKLLGLVKIFFYILLGLLFMQLLSFSTFLNEYTRFGIENIAPNKIFAHLLSTAGSTSVYMFEGGSGGLAIRIHWALSNWESAVSDTYVFLFGQGFGPILTDFNAVNVVREPHNSYLSVFARTGLIGFVMWVFFHIYINLKAFFILLKGAEFLNSSFSIKMLLVVFMTMHSQYWYSLVESGFEAPYTSINYYILLAILIFFTNALSPGWGDSLQKAQGNLPTRSVRVARDGG